MGARSWDVGSPRGDARKMHYENTPLKIEMLPCSVLSQKKVHKLFPETRNNSKRDMCEAFTVSKHFVLWNSFFKVSVLSSFRKVVKFICSSESHSPGGWPRP
jgi:hypothetical protein